MTIVYIIFAAIALGILVFIHELGHYIAAKLVGMKVETFSIGFGRPLLKWRWNQVDWQLGWLPFGGYVRIAGMDVSKKDKKTHLEPYDVPQGFFSKAPWKRIIVALAGPAANLLLAFLIFAGIWGMGGRVKPFSELTRVIGWVDPKSELYALGVRPGDILTKYNGKPFTSSKDLLYAAMLSGKEVELEGYHVDYTDNMKRTPFSYTIFPYPAAAAVEGILTTGVTGMARYLIYNKLPEGSIDPLAEESPMQGSGIQYGDQFVWANGELLFSKDQLNHLLNSNQVLLTVQRQGEVFLSKQPRVPAVDLIFPSYVRDEILDWEYEAGIRTKWNELRVLPYILSPEGYIEAPLDFIDQESKNEAFPLHPYSATLDRPLEAGDRILAVGGVRADSAFHILELVQFPKVQIIVRRHVQLDSPMPLKEGDQQFENSFQWNHIRQIVQTIGTERELEVSGDYVLLNPVEPKPLKDFQTPSARSRIEEYYTKTKDEIEKISDPEKRAKALQVLEQFQNTYVLGINFTDREVLYNPSPFTLFKNVLAETWQTLRALVSGYLHPKWISGPVGIVQVIHHGWTVGLGEALFWIAAISLNLAILNLLPIPVLDGGYICLSLWEMITGRRIKAKTMERLIIPFVILLIGLLIFLTFQDVTRLFS